MDVKELIDNPELAVLIARLEIGVRAVEECDVELLLKMLRKISREHERADHKNMIDEKKFNVMCMSCGEINEVEGAKLSWFESETKLVGINYQTLRNVEETFLCSCKNEHKVLVDVEVNSGDIVRFFGTNCSLKDKE